jgi:radical SAM superfamily enzyme YgiQ (UPF0313 family)
VLIGFQDQGNLGVGYLAATLGAHGFEARILDFRADEDSLLEAVRAAEPLLVGFSLIFQYYLPRFQRLASRLRGDGVTCHFCAGGHYPTLRSEQVLRAVPELDCVVRGEGEQTLLELMQCLEEGGDWRSLAGLAFRQDGRPVVTPARPLVADLDALPWPVRPLEDLAVLGCRASPLLASRGCARNCSFCSIRQFYAQAPGRKVRIRDAVKVVEEMRSLHDERDVRIFLFQDDDFPLSGDAGRRWVARFAEALGERGLSGRVLWKISCRADEVEPALFERLRAAGLYTAYLGLESGNEQGLKTLNKRLGLAENLRAAAILGSLGIWLTYGFMMFDPSSTFETVRQNVAFLRRITGDGSTAVLFGRMMPYAGTPIEATLEAEGRLRGSAQDPDYDFLDQRLNAYFERLNALVSGWIHGPEALSGQLNWAWHEYWVMKRLLPPLPGLSAYRTSLRALVRRSNTVLLDLVESTALAFEAGREELPPQREFRDRQQQLSTRLLAARNAFVTRHQETILGALSRPAA